MKTDEFNEVRKQIQDYLINNIQLSEKADLILISVSTLSDNASSDINKENKENKETLAIAGIDAGTIEANYYYLDEVIKLYKYFRQTILTQYCDKLLSKDISKIFKEVSDVLVITKNFSIHFSKISLNFYTPYCFKISKEYEFDFLLPSKREIFKQTVKFYLKRLKRLIGKKAINTTNTTKLTKPITSINSIEIFIQKLTDFLMSLYQTDLELTQCINDLIKDPKSLYNNLKKFKKK